MKFKIALIAAAAVAGVALVVATHGTAGAQYPPAASNSAVTTAPPQATLGSSVAVATTVVDENGQPVANQTCAFTIVSQPGTGASLSTATGTTNAAGVATVDLNVGSASGEIIVESVCGTTVSRTGVVAGVSTGPTGGQTPSQLPSAGFGPQAGGANAPVAPIILSVIMALFVAKALRRTRTDIR